MPVHLSRSTIKSKKDLRKSLPENEELNGRRGYRIEVQEGKVKRINIEIDKYKEINKYSDEKINNYREEEMNKYRDEETNKYRDMYYSQKTRNEEREKKL